MDHLDYDAVIADIMARKRGGAIVCTYFDENFLNLVPAEQVEGLAAASTTTGRSTTRSASNS